MVVCRCSDCGATLIPKKENPHSPRVLEWWCPKCELGRVVEPEETTIITIDMHHTVEVKHLAARLVPRAGLLEIQPIKVCDTNDEAGNIMRGEAVKDPSYLYTVLHVMKKRG